MLPCGVSALYVVCALVGAVRGLYGHMVKSILPEPLSDGQGWLALDVLDFLGSCFQGARFFQVVLLKIAICSHGAFENSKRAPTCFLKFGIVPRGALKNPRASPVLL